MSENLCPECGCELTGTALPGLCPQCLLKVALEKESQILTGSQTASKSSGGGFVPPTVEELANVIPQIEILELLAKGGMGAVYKGRQKSLDRLVAVKILPPDNHDAAFAERFTREARALAKLNHPNIVAIYDFGNANGLFYFVMEYVEGANLRHLLKEKAFAAKDALAIVPQLCDALQFAHDEGIVHRDIKPENILIDKKGRVKIADFGLAKLLGHEHIDDNLTATHQVMGTIKYMAPEQMEGAKNIDHRADIYSLGVVFYELLTGELPLGRFAPPSKKVLIDVRLDEIVLRALEKEPNLRYQHAEDVKTEVESVVRTPYQAPPPLPKVVADTATPPAAIPYLWESDEIDRPFARWVTFPLIGFFLFCVIVAIAASVTTRRSYSAEMLAFICAFVLFVIWYVRRGFGIVDMPTVGTWTTEQIAAHFQRCAKILRYTAIALEVGWIALVKIDDRIFFATLWAIGAGLFVYLGSRRLARNRDPGKLAIIAAMVPFSPAVVFGLPIGLYLLRTLARPEVKAYLAENAK